MALLVNQLPAKFRQLTAWIMRLPALQLGLCASILITLGSFGGGATRYRGGVLDALGLSFLSYGHGAGFSNVTLWLGTALMVVSWVVLGGQVLQRNASWQWVRKCLVWWLAPLVLAAPIMSRDIYSYLMQGMLLRDGFDPYTQGAAVNPGPVLFEVSHDWRNTTTPYGPLHLWLGELVTRVTGDNITAGIFVFKLLSLAGVAGIIWSVPKIAQLLGTNPAIALWLGVANPIMVFHLVGGLHNESIMVGLVSIGVLFVLQRRFHLGVVIIAIAMALKATAAFVLPFAVWIAVIHARNTHKPQDEEAQRTTLTWPNVRAFLWFAISGAALTIIVLALITWVSGASWGWIEEITGNTKVINPLALPSLLAGWISAVGSLFMEPFPYNGLLSILRTLSMLCMAIGFVAVWWRMRHTTMQAVQGMTLAYCVAFVFNSVTLPWYYASILPLAAVVTMPRRVQQFAIGFSVLIALAFSGSGNHQLNNPVWMVGLVLFGWWCVTALNHAERQPATQGTSLEDATNKATS